jgi:hypothetical protein
MGRSPCQVLRICEDERDELRPLGFKAGDGQTRRTLRVREEQQELK